MNKPRGIFLLLINLNVLTYSDFVVNHSLSLRIQTLRWSVSQHRRPGKFFWFIIVTLAQLLWCLQGLKHASAHQRKACCAACHPHGSSQHRPYTEEIPGRAWLYVASPPWVQGKLYHNANHSDWCTHDLTRSCRSLKARLVRLIFFLRALYHSFAAQYCRLSCFIAVVFTFMD